MESWSGVLAGVACWSEVLEWNGVSLSSVTFVE